VTIAVFKFISKHLKNLKEGNLIVFLAIHTSGSFWKENVTIAVFKLICIKTHKKQTWKRETS